MKQDDSFERRLCRTKKGEIVLRGAVWRKSDTRTALSIYGYTGIKSKRPLLLERTHIVSYSLTRTEMKTQLHNMAYIWALNNGIGDFVYQDKQVQDQRDLYHPSELTKENQS